MAIETTRQYNGRNFLVCFLVSLGAIAFAYPSAIIGVTLAQPSFLIYMGLVDITQSPPAATPNADGIIGAMSGVFQAGTVLNVFIVAWVSDKYGRKRSLQWSSFMSLLGGALSCGSTSPAMFIVGRLFAGAGSGGFLASVPIYTAELAPSRSRGLMVGMVGVNVAIGYAMASWMGLAFYFSNNPATQWRAPLGIALIWPLIMIAVCFIVPESPRYLLMQERVDEARDIVLKLHNLKGDPYQEFARSEFYQMTKQAELDCLITPSWLEILRVPSYRKRFIMAITLVFFGQSTGVLVLNNYGPTIYATLGYDTEKQLIFQSGWIVVGIIANLLGAAVLDRLGRKPLLLFGLVGCCICLSLEAAMVSLFAEAGTNKAGLQMGVAASYLFLFVYSMGIDVAGFVFYSEIFPNHLRARGLSLTAATFGLTNLLYLQVAPTAFRKIGWKFYLVFIILSGLGAIWLWFFVPETKGIPLEEVAQIFGDEVAVYETDVHFDHIAKTLVVEKPGAEHGGDVQRDATEGGAPGHPTVPTDAKGGDQDHDPKVEHLDNVQRS